jgi:cell division transport system permease protein
MRVVWCSMTVASMSMIEPALAALRGRLGRLRRDAGARDRPRGETTIVPRDTIAGSALTAVVAIMTFLAAATSGGVAMVIRSASEYQSDIAREMTIQVRPTPGNDIDAEVLKAESIARATPGMGDVRTYSKAESERLLEPWLGGLALEELPVPRMIAVRVAPGARVDTATLRQALAEKVAGATLDDHRAWIERMRRMAAAAVMGGLGVFGLVLAATVLSVAFATRGAMASNRPIIEVLHFVGANERFISREFERHFVGLGVRAGLVGAISAALVFLLLPSAMHVIGGGPVTATEMSRLVGTGELDLKGYLLCALVVVVVAGLCMITSRVGVIRVLKSYA